MKSFAIIAAVAGAAVAQSNLGDCAQLCIGNMARIANTEFSCGSGDINCFCSRSNWAYGVRDCTAQACDAGQAAQAVAWASSQCNGATAPSGTDLAAVPVLSSAVAGIPSSLASEIASITGSAGSAASSAASAASSAAGSAASDASSITDSLASAASSAASSAESAASSALNSISSALNSATGSLASRASSATSGAGGAPSTSANSAPMVTAMPLAAAAGIAALFL